MRANITLRNYRCFQKESHIEIRTGLSSYIGVNNSGKSAVLRFIYECRDLFTFLSHPGNFESVISGRDIPFTLHGKSETHRALFNVLNDKDTEIEIETYVIKNYTEHSSNWKVRLNINRANGVCRSSLIYNNQIIDATEGPIQFDTTSSIARLRGEIAFYADEFFGIMTDLANTMYFGPFRNTINIGTNESYYDINVGMAFIKSFRILQTSPDSSERIYQLTKDIRNVFEFEEFTIQPSADDTEIITMVNGKRQRLLDMGSGIAQFIIVLVHAAIKKPAYILIDEPELNLHPSLQLDFLTTIASYASKGVMFATHNIGLARSASDYIYSVNKKGFGDSFITPYEETPELPELLGELGYSNYRALGCDKILLVEGRTEIKTIQQFLRMWNKDHKIVLVPMGGSEWINGNSKEALIELKRVSADINVLIDSELKSSDEKIRNDRRAFMKVCSRLNIRCHMLERRAIENYFSYDAVQKVLGSEYRALQPFEKLEEVDVNSRKWKKNRNWQIAREMRKNDLTGTDLGDFLESL